MTVMEKGTARKPAYLDGKTKRMLIDGNGSRRRPARPSRRAIRRPARCSPHVAEGDAEDIDRAVAAARKAFDGPVEQVQAGRAAGAAAEARRSGRAALRGARVARHPRHGRADHAAPRQQPPARARHAALLRRHGDRDARRDDRELAARRDLLLHAEGAGRRRRRDHPVERPARPRRSGRSARRWRPAAPWC